MNLYHRQIKIVYASEWKTPRDRFPLAIHCDCCGIIAFISRGVQIAREDFLRFDLSPQSISKITTLMRLHCVSFLLISLRTKNNTMKLRKRIRVDEANVFVAFLHCFLLPLGRKAVQIRYEIQSVWTRANVSVMFFIVFRSLKHASM